MRYLSHRHHIDNALPKGFLILAVANVRFCQTGYRLRHLLGQESPLVCPGISCCQAKITTQAISTFARAYPSNDVGALFQSTIGNELYILALAA